MAEPRDEEWWNNTYKDIYTGGSKRWKQGEEVQDWKHQYDNIARVLPRVKSLFVPFSGDVRYPCYLRSQAAASSATENTPRVTVVELSAVALQELMNRFEGESFEEESDFCAKGITKYSNCDNTVNLLNGSFWESSGAIKKFAPFDLVFDKDAFGFIPEDKREDYVSLVHSVLSPGGMVYLEVKHTPERKGGPPFHIGEEEIERYWTSQNFKVIKAFGTQPAMYSFGEQRAYMLQKEED